MSPSWAAGGRRAVSGRPTDQVLTVSRSHRRPGLGADFTRLWTANAVSNFGDGVTGVAGPLLVASLTTHPTLVAGAVFAQQLPWLLFALPPGPTWTGWTGGGCWSRSTWPAAPSWPGWPWPCGPTGLDPGAVRRLLPARHGARPWPTAPWSRCCPASSRPNGWRAPTPGCSAPTWSATSSSPRRSGPGCSWSPPRCPSPSTRPASSPPPCWSPRCCARGRAARRGRLAPARARRARALGGGRR
jgi:Transmembrane secretion effector